METICKSFCWKLSKGNFTVVTNSLNVPGKIFFNEILHENISSFQVND